MKWLAAIGCVAIAACLTSATDPSDHPGGHVVILGDSNTYIGGDNCDNPLGWNKWFKDLYRPATCHSYARSGATWTNTSSTAYNVVQNIGKLGPDNTIYNQINRLEQALNDKSQATPSLIIIAAGTNDAWFNQQRPQAFSQSVAAAFCEPLDTAAASILTLPHAVRYACARLSSLAPEAKIVVLTPMQTTATSLEKIRLASDLIDSCASIAGAYVIRQDGCDFLCRDVEEKQRTFTYDGTHTNQRGAKHNGEFITREIQRIILTN